LTIFYLDGFNLSQNKFIRYSQITIFTLFTLYTIYFIISTYYLEYKLPSNIISHINIEDIKNTKNKDVILQGKVVLDKEAGTELAKGVSNFGSNVGLAGCVGSIAAGVSSVIAKSALPPVQKTGLVIIGGISGAALHVIASSINAHRSAKELNPYSSVNESNMVPPKNINKFIDSTGDYSPLELLLQSIYVLDFVCV
jgi:fructose-1,6-bisphosphatase/sedoheptulose 1,7-bisphosphatase-like protein